ncbi:hypothetical protein ICL81_06240 [Leucobacter sp. cx-328]|uniref:hypothetical protein n=1 Tax=unclassified Leucobacter TaxID=2621730 RepID=UPI00165E52C3|nr:MULTISPECIES: hypothetical protein [unclassified Leucobacter]MBC9944114.1 hypothetical protein [Leucobacter sp. cx-328]
MSFFTFVPVPDGDENTEPVAVPSWVQPSQDEIPVAVPYVRELGRARNVMLVLERADVYTEGVKFILRVEARYSQGMTSAEKAALSRSLGEHHYWGDQEAYLKDALRVGLEFSDGSVVDSFEGPDRPWGEKPQKFVLSSLGGSGEGSEDYSRTEHGFWLWPLPPQGVMKLHYMHRGIGVDEGTVEIDAAPLIEASSRVLAIPNPILP